MAQYQVPQFIETEDKIIGPLTLRQFIYLAIAGGTSFILFFVLQTFLWLIITTLLGVTAAAFAFIKINGQPLIRLFFSGLKFAWKPKMYLWQREEAKIAVPQIKVVKPAKEKRPLLKDLWLKLTTGTQAGAKKPARAETDKTKYEIWRKMSGEREVARRIDYR